MCPQGLILNTLSESINLSRVIGQINWSAVSDISLHNVGVVTWSSRSLVIGLGIAGIFNVSLINLVILLFLSVKLKVCGVNNGGVFVNVVLLLELEDSFHHERCLLRGSLSLSIIRLCE